MSGWLEGNCPTCLMRLVAPREQGETPVTKSPPAVEPKLGSSRRLGDYELLEEIARGGMGVVHRARQVSLKRLVAVKVLLAAEFANENSRKRFRREAEAAASLNHPNIVSIYEVGQHDGQPYFAMELIEGRSLAELIRDRPVAARDAAQWLKAIAEAVDFAHQRHILHRDLKPSNVLVDKLGVPHITDFGLAKRIEPGAELTQTGQVLGTPSYMSPEQADPKRGQTTAASDVYSLGALLYHLLAGRAPFLSETVQGILRLVLDQNPVSLHLLNPAVPHDLETICHKCLNKERENRYGTAAELAADLGRWLADEPILARAATPAEKFWRWCRRNPAVSVAAAAAVLAAVLGLSGVLWEWRAARKAQTNEQRMRVQAEADALAARKKAYASDMVRLQQALAADDLVLARELLARQQPLPGQPDLRGWEWRYYWQFCRGDTRFTLCQRSNMIISVSFSSDGALLGVGTRSGEVTVWEIGARRMIFKKEPASNESGRLAFARTGHTLAFYDGSKSQKSVVLWDSATRTEVNRLGLKGMLGDLAFARDGRLFTADLSESNNITVWDPGRGISLSHSTSRLLYYGAWAVFDISSDGSKFAHTIREPGLVRIVDLSGGTGSNLRVAEEHVNDVAFSRDGQTLLTTGSVNGAIKLWDVRTRKLIGSLEGHSRYTTRMRLLPDGRTIASGGGDEVIRLWDLDTREPIRTLRGASGVPDSIDISPDGRWLASGSADGSVDFWDLSSSTNSPPVFRALAAGGAKRWSYSSDGRLVGSIHETRLEFYNALTLQPARDPGQSLTNRYRFAFSPDMRLLVTTDTKGNLAAVDLPSQRLVANFAAHPIANYEAVLAFTSGGTSLLALCQSQIVKEWDIATWKEIRRWQADTHTTASTFSPEADLFATATENGEFELVKAHEPERRRRFSAPRFPGWSELKLSLSRDGKTLAVANGNGSVELWNTETLTRKALLRGTQFDCFSVTTSPDGQRVAASGSGRGAIRIWDIDSHEELATFAAGLFFDDVRFSPDGNTIGAQSLGGVLHFWSAPSWAEIAAGERARLGHE